MGVWALQGMTSCKRDLYLEMGPGHHVPFLAWCRKGALVPILRWGHSTAPPESRRHLVLVAISAGCVLLFLCSPNWGGMVTPGS